MATAWVVVATAPAQVETAVVEVKDQVVLAVAVRVVGAEEVRVTELLDSAVAVATAREALELVAPWIATTAVANKCPVVLCVARGSSAAAAAAAAPHALRPRSIFWVGWVADGQATAAAARSPPRATRLPYLSGPSL